MIRQHPDVVKYHLRRAYNADQHEHVLREHLGIPHPVEPLPEPTDDWFFESLGIAQYRAEKIAEAKREAENR